MLLDSKEIKHPPLEFIFTVDEEVGMKGAENIDVSVLEGKALINLDSEEGDFSMLDVQEDFVTYLNFQLRKKRKMEIIFR